MTQLSTDALARIILTIVTHYPHLVTPTMHAGIDLARTLASGDQPLATEDQVVTATIADTYQQLGEAAIATMVEHVRIAPRNVSPGVLGIPPFCDDEA